MLIVRTVDMQGFLVRFTCVGITLQSSHCVWTVKLCILRIDWSRRATIEENIVLTDQLIRMHTVIRFNPDSTLTLQWCLLVLSEG